MKLARLFFVFLVLGHWTIGQAQNLSSEDLFKRYLVSEDESIANIIVNSNDGLYSLYCKAALTENLAEKISLYTNFIEQNPKQGLAKAYFNRGIAYSLSKEYGSAILNFNKAIQIDSNEPYTFYFRGESYLSLEQYEEAIKDFSQAIKLLPNFVYAYHLRGLAYLSQKNYSISLADLNKVIELDKDYDQGYLIRGMIHFEMGEYKLAIADWKQAKKINSRNAEDVDSLIDEANKKLKEKN